MNLAADLAARVRRLDAALEARPEDARLLAARAGLKRHPEVALYSEAVEDAERAAALAPKEPWARGEFARALAAAGRTEDAERVLGAAGRTEPGWMTAERALLALAGGRPEQALAHARRARARDPRGPEASLALAAALARSGLWDEAAKEARRAAVATEAEPMRRPGAHAPEPWALLADLEAARGRYAASAQARLRALSTGGSPGWPLPVDGEEREKTLSGLKGLALARPRDAWAWAWLGQIQAQAGLERDAGISFSRALKLDAGHAAARAWRATLRESLGDLPGALADLSRARRCESAGLSAAALARERGRLELCLGKTESAVKTLKRAVALGGGRPETRRLLAEALTRLERREEAREALDLCLEESPNFRDVYAERAALRPKGDSSGADNDRARASGSSLVVMGVRDPLTGFGPAEGPAVEGRGRAVVDPRLELVGVLQGALDPVPASPKARRLLPEMAEYEEEARRRFSSAVDGELREAFGRMATARGNKDFPWFGVSQMMMEVSLPPALAPSSPAWRAAEDLALLSRMRRFVERTRFSEFVSARRPLYARWTAPLDQIMRREDYAATVSAYAGRRASAYYDVVLAPLLRGVRLRAILRGPDGARGSRTVLSPLSGDEALETYRSADKSWLLWTGWHETLHMFLDPWCGLYEPESRRYAGVYPSLPKHVRRKNWMDSFSEHFVRAATQRLLRARLGAGAQRKLELLDRAEGYHHHAPLARALDEYESHRDRYPTLLAFMPRWMRAWEASR